MAEWEELAADQYAHEVKLKPGVEAFLARCRREGRSLAVFTACRPNLCRVLLDRCGLTDWFEAIIYAEEIGLEKHNPACFARLSELLGVAAEECTFFDDSPSNCATARAAGMKAVGVYDFFYSHRWEEMQTICTRCVRSLEELL
jgi:HAD superfamily hydrolase (TIGR01509 family)